MIIDPIGDMLSRIRNAALAGKREVYIPMSKTKYKLAEILEKENWIGKVEKISADKSEQEDNADYSPDQIKILLKYKKSGKSAITKIKRVSRPGLKIYKKNEELPVVLNNFGIAIISTPVGLMTNKEAKKKGHGGEVLCEVY